MKYTYAYKTSDGARHEASMEASSREEVFAELRNRGIRPIKVLAADGSKANGEIRGVRRRVVVVLVALTALAVGGAAFLLVERNRTSVRLGPLPRHQVYGEPAVLNEFERTNFAGVFRTEGERYLAWFARPGLVHSFSDPDWRRRLAEALPSALTNEIVFSATDSLEATEFKRILAGMKNEIRRYLANGIGTPERYVKRLEERQRREAQLYALAEQELAKEADPEVFERRNAALRAIGLRTVALPEDRR